MHHADSWAPSDTHSHQTSVSAPLPPPPAPSDDPDGLEAQVAALLGAAGSLSAHAMAEADAALAPKVGGRGGG